jgi:hypothetical protein
MTLRLLGFTFALLAAGTTAFAGAPITVFPAPPIAADSLRNANGLPVPEVAARKSAHSTLMAAGIGATISAVGLLAADNRGGDTGGGAGVFMLGVAVYAAGVVVGPSSGHRYGGLDGRGAAGILVRTGLLCGPALAMAYSPSRHFHEDDAYVIVVGSLAGLGLATLGAVFDIETVEGAVRRRNEALQHPTSWRLEPCVTPTTHAPGLALRATFGGPAGS